MVFYHIETKNCARPLVLFLVSLGGGTGFGSSKKRIAEVIMTLSVVRGNERSERGGEVAALRRVTGACRVSERRGWGERFGSGPGG